MNWSMEKNADRPQPSEFQQDLEFLRQVQLFQGLDYECLKLMTMLSKRIELIPGDQLITQGEDDGSGYYIILGQLKSFHHKDGKDFIVQSYEAGQFLGGLALLGITIRLFTVQAVTESVVLRIKREGFQKIMQQFPNTMAKIGSNLAADLTRWEQNQLSQADDKSFEPGNLPLGISLI